MLSGLQEILLLIVIALCVFFLPRLLNNQNKHSNQIMLESPLEEQIDLKWKPRFLMIVSFIWLVSFAIYIKPWENTFIPYIVVGVGPVFLVWSIFWIKAGIK